MKPGGALAARYQQHQKKRFDSASYAERDGLNAVFILTKAEDENYYDTYTSHKIERPWKAPDGKDAEAMMGACERLITGDEKACALCNFIRKHSSTRNGKLLQFLATLQDNEHCWDRVYCRVFDLLAPEAGVQVLGLPAKWNLKICQMGEVLGRDFTSLDEGLGIYWTKTGQQLATRRTDPQWLGSPVDHDALRTALVRAATAAAEYGVRMALPNPSPVIIKQARDEAITKLKALVVGKELNAAWAKAQVEAMPATLTAVRRFRGTELADTLSRIEATLTGKSGDAATLATLPAADDEDFAFEEPSKVEDGNDLLDENVIETAEAIDPNDFETEEGLLSATGLEGAAGLPDRGTAHPAVEKRVRMRVVKA